VTKFDSNITSIILIFCHLNLSFPTFKKKEAKKEHW